MANCSDVGRCSTNAEKIVYIFLIPTICSLSVIFNMLVLLVFSRSNFQARIGSSTLTYLRGLAVADGIASLVYSPVGFVRCLESSSPGQEQARNLYDKYVFLPFANTFATASVWITVAVSLERCIFVSMNKVQVNHKAMFRTRSARLALVVIFVSALSICFPMFFYYGDLSMENHNLMISNFGSSVDYEIYSWIRMFLAKLIPIAVVTASNTILVRTTWTRNRRVSVMMPTVIHTRRTQTQYRLTYMLLSISTIFVVCNVAEPFAQSGVYKVLFGECSIYTVNYYLSVVFVNMFEMISFACNFICYCVFHKHFRDTLRLVITCDRRKPTPVHGDRRITRQIDNQYAIRTLNGSIDKCIDPGPKEGPTDRASTSHTSGEQRRTGHKTTSKA